MPLAGLQCVDFSQEVDTMSTLSAIKLMALGGLSGVLVWELFYHTGSHRRSPAKSLHWMTPRAQTVRYDQIRSVWIVSHKDVELQCVSKQQAEELLDIMEGGAA